LGDFSHRQLLSGDVLINDTAIRTLMPSEYIIHKNM
jgi:hypothetical protein